MAELTDDVLDGDDLRATLVQEIGFSEQIIDDLFHVWSPPTPPGPSP